MKPADNVYFDAPGVASVRWEPKTDVVFVEWEGWSDSTELTALLAAEIRDLIDHRCSRLLALPIARGGLPRT
jgi:hypothetical protein